LDVFREEPLAGELEPLVFIGDSDGDLVETGLGLVVELDFAGDCLFGDGSAEKLVSCPDVPGDRLGLGEVVDERL